MRRTFQPLVRIHGTSQLIINGLAYLSIPALPALAFVLQSHIPGVKNLYPWVFPLIVANLFLTSLVFVAAVRLQLPRDRALMRLAQLRTEGVNKRNKGLSLPTIAYTGDTPSSEEVFEQLGAWIELYRGWTDEVRDEIAKLSPLQAELWATLGDVPVVTRTPFSGDHARYMNFFNERLRRLDQTIDRLRQ